MAVVHDKKDIGEEYRSHILKFVPQLRDPLLDLTRAAQYLEDWVNGELTLNALLDVSA